MSSGLDGGTVVADPSLEVEGLEAVCFDAAGEDVAFVAPVNLSGAADMVTSGEGCASRSYNLILILLMVERS
jgi:hypothetical protein